MKSARPRDGFDLVRNQTGAMVRGTTGSAVRELQRKLLSLGYLRPDAAATGPGVFGPRTEDAVRAFQKRHALKVTGVVGSYTQAALTAAMDQLTGRGASIPASGASGIRSAVYQPQHDGAVPAAGLTDPANQPVSAPVSSNLGDRSAARYADVINQFAVGANPRYATGNRQTSAHVFVSDVTTAMGAAIPRQMGGFALNANGMCGWLRGMGAQSGWKLADARTAQDAANAGCPAVASWRNPSGVGHLAVVRPGRIGASGPAIAQAGPRNFNSGFVENGFGAVQPDYWVHR